MRLRPPTPDDAAGVADLLAARDTADLGVPDVAVADVEEEWAAADVDLAADAVVVGDPAAGIVGYALVRALRTVAVVHPDHEGRGLGARLLAFAEDRAAATGRRRHQWVGAGNARARELLTGAGYRGVASWWRMARPLDGDVVAPPPPAGVTLRSIDPAADAEALHAVDEQAFGGTPEFQLQTLAAFAADHLQPHDFDREVSRIAERDGVAVGLLLARRWADAGFVAVLGVRPDERGRGLGAALLGAAFAGFAQAGLPEAQLGVAAHNVRAMRLYTRAGMRPRFRVDGYER